MDAMVELDKLGRFVVPKRIRDALHVRPGDKLKATVSGDVLTIEAIHQARGLYKHNGRYVFDGGPVPNIDIVKLIHEQREERARHVLGTPERE